MNWKEEVQAWIQWSRENLPRTGDYPKINVIEIKGVTCPWWEEIYDLFERSDGKSRNELLTLFEDQLSRDPGDISIRFTALNLHYALSHYDSMLNEDHVGEPRADFAKNLGYLVRLLEVEKCEDWRSLRWEILNAYAIRDWDRALKLYNHIGTLSILEPAEIQLLRGQFNFLVVFGPRRDSEFDPLEWEPKLYDSADWIKELLLFGWSLARKEEITLDDAERDRISDAANDLNKGLKKRANTSLAYRSILAMCHFAEEDYLNAAKHYAGILKDPTVSTEVGKFHMLKVPTYLSLARSYRLAGEPEKAQDVLRGCAEEFPNEKGIYPVLAEIQAQEGQHLAAYESLRKELERNPAFGEDWLVSTSLALGNLGRNTEQIATAVKSYLKSNLERFELLDSLLKAHWSSLANLSIEAREEWIGGSHLMLSLPVDAQLRRLQAEAAAGMFAKAVELQLKSEVFERFRQVVLKSPELQSLAQQEVLQQKPNVFCDYLIKKKPLTLGQMWSVLERCKKVNQGTLGKFSRWVQKRQSALLKILWLLAKICAIRKPAAHGSISIEDAEQMPGFCQQFLSELKRDPV